MKFGAQLRRIWEYYRHREINQRLSDAEASLVCSQEHAKEIRETIIKPARKVLQENSFRHIIVESLQLGHNGNGR